MRKVHLAIILLACGLYLTSCTSSAETSEPTPTNTVQINDNTVTAVRETAVSTTTPISNPSPSATPTLPLPPIGTDAPTQVPTATPTPVSCDDPPFVEVASLELNSLFWKVFELDGQSVRNLIVPDFLPFLIDISPDQKWLATAFQNIGGEAAIALIDTVEDAHWWVIKNAYQAAHPGALFQQWLSNGEVVWLDGMGQLLVGNKQSLQTFDVPTQMLGIQYAASDIAFAQDEETNLWRVDLESGQWEEVVPTSTNLGSYYGIATDGSYAFTFQGGQAGAQMWRIPTEMGAAAQPLPNVEMPLDIVGSGQPRPLPRQLANSPYWLITLPILLEGTLTDGIFAGGIIVDIRDGSVLSATNLGASSAFYVTGFDLSPNGEWIEIVLTDAESGEIANRMIAPADDLTSGYWLESSTVHGIGWVANPPAIIFRDEAAGSLSVAALPLTDETPVIPLPDAGELLTTLSGSIITTAADNPARVLQFGLDGSLLNSLDLSSQYESVEIAKGAAQRVYLAAIGHQSQENTNCTYGLIEWTLK